MLNLIAKDIKLLLGGKEKGVSLFLRVLFLVLGLGVLVFVESYLYREILTKLSSFPGASLSFTTLFLFIVSLFSILFSLLQAEKLLFDESDRRDMDILPISPTKKKERHGYPSDFPHQKDFLQVDFIAWFPLFTRFLICLSCSFILWACLP